MASPGRNIKGCEIRNQISPPDLMGYTLDTCHFANLREDPWMESQIVSLTVSSSLLGLGCCFLTLENVGGDWSRGTGSPGA